MSKFNKANPQVVVIKHLIPKRISVAVAKAWGFTPPCPMIVLLDRETHEFNIVGVRL